MLLNNMCESFHGAILVPKQKTYNYDATPYSHIVDEENSGDEGNNGEESWRYLS